MIYPYAIIKNKYYKLRVNTIPISSNYINVLIYAIKQSTLYAPTFKYHRLNKQTTFQLEKIKSSKLKYRTPLKCQSFKKWIIIVIINLIAKLFKMCLYFIKHLFNLIESAELWKAQPYTFFYVHKYKCVLIISIF